MAADLGLVPHPAQGDAHEAAAHGAGDGLAERGLAHAGRTHEAEDGAADLVDQLLHGQVLEDPLLGLLQPVVILVEDPLGLGDLQLVLGLLVPGEREDPVDVVAHHGRLGAHRAHHLELLELLLDLEGGLLGHLLVLDLLLELLDLVLELVALTQLLLDGLHLLVEVVLLLRLLHLLLDAGADLLLDLQDLDLALHQLVELLEPLGRGLGLEDGLLVVQLEREVRDDGVGQPRRVVDGRHADQHLGRDALVELDVGLEGRVHRAHQRLELHRPVALLLDLLHLDREEVVVRQEAPDPGAALALDQHLHRAVGQAEQLDDGRWCRRRRCRRRGVVGLGLLLGAEQDLLVAPIASSSAAIDFSRPTNSGTTMCGKTMMSRKGRSGRTRVRFPSFLPSSLREKMATARSLLASTDRQSTT